MPGTTLTHFLLGFNLQKGIAKSTIQPQGVLGAVRSPFHAILALLRPIQGSVELPPAFAKMPNLVVASMKLIYTLCANIMTSEVTLRFLRSSEDFLCRQVGLLPWTPMPPGSSVCGHRATAWLMKTVAIEVINYFSCLFKIFNQFQLFVYIISIFFLRPKFCVKLVKGLNWSSSPDCFWNQ